VSTDYLVASLPALVFGQPAPLSREQFDDRCGALCRPVLEGPWRDLETQLRNALADARGGAKYRRPATGCSLYWANRVAACFQEHDAFRREELIDKVWWDAAGELTPPTDPLGKGALATYSVRLDIALKRSRISTDGGYAAFDSLTSETKWQPK